MKLDFDTIKAILEKAAERHQVNRTLENSDFPESEREAVAFQVMHLQYRGYIEADYIPNLSVEAPAAFSIKGLTFEGHSLLKLMHDAPIWAETRKVIEENGMAMGFESVQSALSSVITAMITDKSA